LEPVLLPEPALDFPRAVDFLGDLPPDLPPDFLPDFPRLFRLNGFMRR